MREFFSPDYLLSIGDKAIKLIAILLIAIVACKVFALLIDRFFHTRAGMQKFMEEKRARTLSAVLNMVAHYTVYFIATVMILQEFRIDTTSILAGAGIIGLAVGVGAQGLVKDVVTGFFVILEDQYAVGDYIMAGNLEGTVEELGFRVTKLRDANGVLHIIPNGTISKISNYTRGDMQAVIDIPVAYEAGIEKVQSLLTEVCRAIQSMPEVLDEPRVLGIIEFQQGHFIIRVMAKTAALMQGKVEAAFRHQVKLLFEAEHIPTPAPAWNVKLQRVEDKA